LSGTVQLDVVTRGLVGDEEFPQVRRTAIVGTDSTVRNAAQVLAMERLEGEPCLFVSSLYRLHLEFLPCEWFTAFEGSDIKILISLEPSLLVNIEEGEPFGAEGSLETPAGPFSLSLSCQLGSKQAGNHHEAVLFSHTCADVRAYLAVLNVHTVDTAIFGTLNESLSFGIVDGEASILGDELELLQLLIALPLHDLVRKCSFASHLLILVVHKSVEAPFVVDSSQKEALVLAYAIAFLVNLLVVHSEPYVFFCHLEYERTFFSFE
jgi:hypothetical protein